MECIPALRLKICVNENTMDFFLLLSLNFSIASVLENGNTVILPKVMSNTVITRMPTRVVMFRIWKLIPVISTLNKHEERLGAFGVFQLLAEWHFKNEYQ